MCAPPENATWRQRIRHAWDNAFYRNSTIYVMVVLTINLVLNLIPLTRDHCGL